ncbi:MAG: ABC transporter substrate-binding protein [Flavobacteriales bacterium]
MQSEKSYSYLRAMRWIYSWILFGFAGCQLSGESPDVTSEKSIQAARYAEGFRWRDFETSQGSERCLEILSLDRNAIECTVYRDSTSFSADQAQASPSVVLGSGGLVTMSSTHVALMEPWDPMLLNWSGGGYLDFLQSKSALERIKNKEVSNFGGNPEWDHEVIVNARFKAFCIYPYGNPLKDLVWAKDLPIVPIVEYAERTPLGRAEWMRALAWMVGDLELAEADSAFNAIAIQYEAVKSQPLPGSDSLLVFTGSFDQGAWSAPSGNSFIATLLQDAGSKYVFANRMETENVQVSIEELIEIRNHSDAWGIVLSHPSEELTLTDLKVMNPQNSIVIPIDGKVFYANTQTCDYFGWWVAHPDALLQNIRALLYEDSDIELDSVCFKWISQ